jgi:peptidoglycan/xylan/chitin deacetylase (PgdA/CDA1 family)
LLGWLGRAPGHLRVLTFHDIGGNDADLSAVTRERLAEYLSLLEDEGYLTLRARDVLASWPSLVDRQRVVLLTFDDGYASHAEFVAELLARHDMTATFFAISSLVAPRRVSGVFEGADHEFLSSHDMRQLESHGFEVGSHTHTHPLLGPLPEDRLEDELTVSKKTLEQELGHHISSFAYPYGRQDAFTSRTRAALMRAGYGIAFTQAGTRIQRNSDLLSLPRTGVDRLDTIASFRRKLEGDYDFIGSLRRYGGLPSGSAEGTGA